MSSVNKAILIGNLGKDPEMRALNDGTLVANLSLATSESWKDKNSGERKEKTEWHRVTIFGKVAEVAEKYLRKGSKVYLEGQIQTRKWTDQSGNDRYTTEIVLQPFRGQLTMLGDKPAPDKPGPEQRSAPPHPRVGERSGTGADLDDEIPW